MPRGCGVIADLSLHSGRARRQARAIDLSRFSDGPTIRCGELGIGTETFRKTVPGFSRHSAQGLRAEACSDCFSQLAMASRTRSRVLIAPSANTVRWAVTPEISKQAPTSSVRRLIAGRLTARQVARCPAFSTTGWSHSPWLRHRPLPHAAHFGRGWADGLSRTALMPDSLLRMI
jgi:hypothetical protein